jgi:hypothetical protein
MVPKERRSTLKTRIDRRDLTMEYLVPLFENPWRENIPYWVARSHSDHSPTISITGSFDPKEVWQRQILENSRMFKFVVVGIDGKFWYDKGDPVRIILLCADGYDRQVVERFESYTGTPEECADKMQKWLKQCINNPQQPNFN